MSQGAPTGPGDRDYLFDFWTAFGWTVLSCGFYSIYVVYQLVARMRDHNRRRLVFLDAAYRDAWQRAVANGTAEGERPVFERMAANLDALRRLDTEFREPALFAALCLIANGIMQLVVYVVNDGDLIKHHAAESAIETDLATVTGRSHLLPAPDPAKPAHNYGGRIAATLLSCGIYSFWWLADIMREGNDHFRRDWAWEDAWVTAG